METTTRSCRSLTRRCSRQRSPCRHSSSCRRRRRACPDSEGRAVRASTSRPFGINLFAQGTAVDDERDARAALDRVAPVFAELGLAVPAPPKRPPDAFADQLAAALDSGAAMFSFTFGVISAEAIAAVRQRGMLLAGTATTVDEAIALEESGVEVVIAECYEAGGHRGSFLADFESSMIGTIALVPQIVDATRVPVVASGGVMDGRGIAAALALGATAVQMGTAFLTCEERA